MLSYNEASLRLTLENETHFGLPVPIVAATSVRIVQ
jgi:hypothetical protein